MPMHSRYCQGRYEVGMCNCSLIVTKEKRIADKILLRIKAIEDERDSLFRIIGQCVIRGEDYSHHKDAVLTADARIDELRSVLKDIDAS